LKNVVQRLLLKDVSVVSTSVLREVLPLSPELNAAGGPTGASHLHFDEIRTLREMEPILRKKYLQYVRTLSSSDAEAARKLGLAPPNYHRICKELGLKS
jgi:two-component system, NtrC family, response regulator AtoC